MGTVFGAPFGTPQSPAVGSAVVSKTRQGGVRVADGRCAARIATLCNGGSGQLAYRGQSYRDELESLVTNRSQHRRLPAPATIVA